MGASEPAKPLSDRVLRECELATLAGSFGADAVANVGEIKPAAKNSCNAISVTVWLHIMRNQMVTHLVEPAFHALGDPTRRAMLDLLRRGDRPAGDIAQSFSVSRPAISKHLRVLRRANLVHERRAGRNRIYRLNLEPLQAVDRWLAEYRVFWTTKLEDLKAYVEAGQSASRSAAAKKPSPAKRRKPL